MKARLMLVGVILLTLFSCKQNTKQMMDIHYPVTKQEDSASVYFDTEVKDPFRWLEDDLSEDTKQWYTAQNKLTFGYLATIPYRQAIKERITQMLNYERVSAPQREGSYIYYYKNNGLQNHSIVYRKKEGSKIEEMFLNPNMFSKDATISLGDMSFSGDGSLLAYSISEGGSDWRKVIIMRTETKEIIEDTLKNVKFSDVSWYKNEGIFYSSYDKPKGSELSAQVFNHKLYYHVLNTKQVEDDIIYGAEKDEKYRYVSASVTEDNNYLFIYPTDVTSGRKVIMMPLDGRKEKIMIVNDTESNCYVVDNDDDRFYMVVDRKAKNKKLVKFTLNNYEEANWKDVIPEQEQVLSLSTAGNYFFATYMVDALSKTYQFDKKGNQIREIKLPGQGTASGFSGKKTDTKLFYNFSNYITPSSIYELDIETGNSQLYRASKANFDTDKYESKQVFYISKDGTKVPMIISYRKGLKLNGKNPTILYGYGGFNISLRPYFSTTASYWMEIGGIYAVANLRGGGEYGRQWYADGTQLKKQNVFDDCIAAAQYLIDNQYTSSEYLAVKGGSNGGLLVGVMMTQRPDLFRVALPAVGVLDMLRYHKFTAGAGWSHDYGTAEDSKEMFEYLKKYSPLHNIKENTNYPATLITTGSHDDRVVPAHSFKFAATLQTKASNNKRPLLIRVETKAGHGAGTSIEKMIDNLSDIYSFTLYNMDYKTVPKNNAE